MRPKSYLIDFINLIVYVIFRPVIEYYMVIRNLLEVNMPRRKSGDGIEKVSCNNFGMRVREIRLKKKITKERFAEQIGVQPSYIPQLERGEKNPSFDVLINIIMALEVTPDELLCDYSIAEKQTINNKININVSELSKSDQRHIEQLVNFEIEYLRKTQKNKD